MSFCVTFYLLFIKKTPRAAGNERFIAEPLNLKEKSSKHETV